MALSQFAGRSGELDREVEDLATLAQCGLPVATIIVVPPEVEAEFYRLNNLGERLQERFSGVNLGFPDDEDIEDLAPAAEATVYGHYLLDEFIDAFYAAIEGLPDELRIRRPGEDGITVSGARGALLGLKRNWSASWSFDSVWARLSASGELMPPPRPLLLHAAELAPLPAVLSRDASALLGRPLELLGDPVMGISRIVQRGPVGGGPYG